ncbi:segregation and condensation protein A [Terriglobus aquaticus]|uniref:Segregation and condensation protein A n=1 Tax=Terriglobus aquaticus TaxID=940139 RepID=A0ABW9KH46_9BACT|nr:segregation/condensation protein A [Terriglobus aquaticus]
MPEPNVQDIPEQSQPDTAETPVASAPLVLEHPAPAPPKPVPARKKKEDAKEELSQSPFSITVGQVYDGPMDLLLDLIRKQDIDIYDIPIAKITAQFLAYTEQLKQQDVDSAGDFIYTASLLIHIKSKMLLPREASLIASGDAEDPRRELVERLLEHERFKAAAQMLLQKQQIEDATWTNPGAKEFTRVDEGEREIAADTTDLVRVFQEILERIRKRPVLNVNEETVTVAQMLEYTKRRLMLEDRPTSLRKLLQNTHSQQALICMFLAMLELVRLQAILLRQGHKFGDIVIKKTENFDEVLAHQERMRDDWR